MGVFTHLWIVMVLVFPVLIERGAIVSSGAAEIDYQLHLKSLSSRIVQPEGSRSRLDGHAAPTSTGFWTTVCNGCGAVTGTGSVLVFTTLTS